MKNLPNLEYVRNGIPTIVPCVELILCATGLNEAHILDFVERAVALVGQELISHEKGRLSRFDKHAHKKIPLWMQTRDSSWMKTGCPDGIHLQFTNKAMGASQSSIEIFLCDTYYFGASETENKEGLERLKFRDEKYNGNIIIQYCTYLRVTIPLNHRILNSPQMLRAWVEDLVLVREGEFIQGSCGIALNSDVAAGSFESQQSEFCKIYPGLSFRMSPGTFGDYLIRYQREKHDILPFIRRVDWLTLVSEKAVEFLGGIDALRKALGGPADYLHQVAHGVVICAQEEPALGFRPDKDFLPEYRRVAKALRPIRIPKLKARTYSSDFWKEDWLNAFDQDFELEEAAKKLSWDILGLDDMTEAEKLAKAQEMIRTQMVTIPAGEFLMGWATGPLGSNPIRKVFLDEYQMQKFCVTNALWKMVMGNCPSPEHLDHPDQPVVDVSWDEALQFAQRVGFSLPTEIQWEKAARGPQGFEYGTQSGRLEESEAHFGLKTTQSAKVGSYPPNGYGLYDMCGNVWQWVHACDPGPSRDPKNQSVPDFGRLCGNSWCSVHLENMHTAYRNYLFFPGLHNDMTGFRVATNAKRNPD